MAETIFSGARYRSLDVTQPSAWDEAIEEAEAEFGTVNALFNNAGVLGYGGVKGCSPAAFRRIIDVNLFGVFLGMRAVAPALKTAGGGVIINTSSTAGLQGYGGLAAYVASKWCVRGLTKSAAPDLAPDNIRVVSLHPGPIRTPMTKQISDEVASAQPIPRFGEAIEVARMGVARYVRRTFACHKASMPRASTNRTIVEGSGTGVVSSTSAWMPREPGFCLDLTAFFVPVDLRELTLTEGAEYGETWFKRGTNCFQVKADRGAACAGQDCGIGVQGRWGVAAELLSLAEGIRRP